jgi:hypothetical protein
MTPKQQQRKRRAEQKARARELSAAVIRGGLAGLKQMLAELREMAKHSE